MKLAIIGMGIMGCRYAKMISDGLVKGIEITAVTRITSERKKVLSDIFDKGAVIFQTADELFGMMFNQRIRLEISMEDALRWKAEQNFLWKVHKEVKVCFWQMQCIYLHGKSV